MADLSVRFICKILPVFVTKLLLRIFTNSGSISEISLIIFF